MPRKPEQPAMSGAELRHIRKTLGFSLAALSSYLGRSVSSVANMESGNSPILCDAAIYARLLASEKGIPEYTPDQTSLTAAHLSAFRRKFGLSQADMSAKLSTPLATWRNWESGRIKPPLALRAKLVALARKLTKGEQQ